MNELRVCPFCGSHNVKIFYDERQNYHVECYGCNKTVSFHIAEQSSQAKAIEIWNRRTWPENKPLTCEGCTYDNCTGKELPCVRCARRYGDYFEARKPEQEEK